jgi:uncharacterized caspase-like protein
MAMKTARIIVMLFAAMFLPFIADSDDRTIRRNKPSATSERRTALVIGNSNYAGSPLKNPANDARDMAKTLEELGFDVIHRENAGKKAIREGIRDFEKKLRGGGVGLFYFAGHGMQVGGKNYLIPTDAQIETEADVEDAAVEANWILGKMEDAGNEINIVILDACRNNPVARSFRSASAGLAEMKAPKGAVIAYATSPGDVAADGNGKNGTYTKYLLKYLREPGLEIGQFFKKVGKDVAAETGEKQMPWMHSKFYGDFYFLADSGSIATEKPQIPAEPAKPKQATLNITADVSGAEVWVNGNKQGVLPRNFTISESGKYEVEVTAPGYKKYRTSKNIEIGKEYEVAVHLEKERVEAAPVVKPPVQQSSVSGAKYHLRSELMTASYYTAEKVFKLKKNDYGWLMPLEYIENDFRNNGDGTITDRATGLMWQQSGSSDSILYDNAKTYVENLNREGFAGHSDWRLPTVDELKSLLTSDKQSNNLYINPIFDKKQWNCWTSDQSASGGAWSVTSSDRYVSPHDFITACYVRAVRSLQ